MKRFTMVTVAASLLLGVCLFVTGCGSSSDAGNKMSSGDNMMSADKMGGDKMGGDKMGGDKMWQRQDGRRQDVRRQEISPFQHCRLARPPACQTGSLPEACGPASFLHGVPPMQQLEHKHPRPIRWMHWMNVVLLSGMIWSGLLIYWANDVYGVRIGSRELFHFFPDWFYRGLGLNHRLAEGMAWHFTLMWGFALNGLAYVAYTLCVRRMASSGTQPQHVSRSVAGDPARPASQPRGAAPPEVQRGPATCLHRRDPDGFGLAADRPGDLQAGAVRRG